MKYILKIIKKVDIKKGIILSIIVSSFFAFLSLTSLVYPYIYSNFIKSLQNKTDYVKYIYIYLAIIPGSLLIEFILIYIFGKINSKNDQKIRFFLYNNIKNLKEIKIKEKGEGFYEKLMDTTLFNILRLFTPAIFIKCVSILKYFFIVFILFKVNYITGLISVFTLIIYFLNYLYNKKVFIRNYKKVITSLTDFYSFFFESISMTSLFSTFPFLNNKNNLIAKEKIKNLNESVRIHEFFGDTFYKLISNFAVPMFQIVLFLYLGKIYFENKITIPEIILIIGYFSQISPIFDDVSEISKSIHQANESASEMLEIIDCADKEKYFEPDIYKKVEKKFFLKFDNLSIKYNNKIILSNINLKTEINSIYALVGLTGNGKSSLINYIFNQGINFKGYGYFLNEEIKIDEYNLNNYILYISQDSYILNDYLEENIKLGYDIKSNMDNFINNNYNKNIIKNRNFNDETNNNINENKYKINGTKYKNNMNKYKNNYLDEIIKLVELEKLKGRMLGVGGKNISGGEKRKINIARFLYHIDNFDFFILDEPFVSMDNILKNKILNILKKR